MSAHSICLSTGHYYGYVAVQDHSVPIGFDWMETYAPKYTVAGHYGVNVDGSRGKFIKNATYSCLNRLFYTLPKSTGQKRWTPLNFSPVSGELGIWLTYPLFNSTSLSVNGTVYNSAGARKFLGVVYCSAYISVIQSFLRAAYEGTDRRVFIVDVTSGYLVAASWDVDYYTYDSTGTKVRYNVL
jgi:hypothetical protein